MNVIFLSLARVSDIKGHGIYTDLLRLFRDRGHQVIVACTCHTETSCEQKDGVTYLYVRTLPIQKTGIVKKGIGTILLEHQFKQAIRKYVDGTSLDLILYATPPVTLAPLIKYLKRKNSNARSYLLLKDIFPQNAVDLGYFPQKSFFYWYFRRKEKQLYRHSDRIGCMSPANVAYVRAHNGYYPADRVEVAPNSIELRDESGLPALDKETTKKEYGLPVDTPVFIYGGNLGKPQGIDYLIQCLEANLDRADCFFLVIGGGTEYQKLNRWYQQHKDKNVRVMQGLPKEVYEKLVRCSDVGLIFLDHRFTIPNYPSRLLSYLEYKLPVICATDIHTDIGRIAEGNGYGYWCESVNPDDFTALIDKMLHSDRKQMGERGYQFLKENYLVEHTYRTIMKHIVSP